MSEKIIYEVDDEVEIINQDPLPGNNVNPPVKIGERYKIKNIVLDRLNNQHLDLGLKSKYFFITSWETMEQLPEGDEIHWVNPIRVKLVN